MTLGDKRRDFTHMMALLILHADKMGYGVAADFLKRCEDCPVGHKTSLHKQGLAVDLNLYSPNGDYLTDPKHHDVLHDYWDMLGGAERIENDRNHYSLAHDGMR